MKIERKTNNKTKISSFSRESLALLASWLTFYSLVKFRVWGPAEIRNVGDQYIPYCITSWNFNINIHLMTIDRKNLVQDRTSSCMSTNLCSKTIHVTPSSYITHTRCRMENLITIRITHIRCQTTILTTRRALISFNNYMPLKLILLVFCRFRANNTNVPFTLCHCW